MPKMGNFGDFQGGTPGKRVFRDFPTQNPRKNRDFAFLGVFGAPGGFGTHFPTQNTRKWGPKMAILGQNAPKWGGTPPKWRFWGFLGVPRGGPKIGILGGQK